MAQAFQRSGMGGLYALRFIGVNKKRHCAASNDYNVRTNAPADSEADAPGCICHVLHRRHTYCNELTSKVSKHDTQSHSNQPHSGGEQPRLWALRGDLAAWRLRDLSEKDSGRGFHIRTYLALVSICSCQPVRFVMLLNAKMA